MKTKILTLVAALFLLLNVSCAYAQTCVPPCPKWCFENKLNCEFESVDFQTVGCSWTQDLVITNVPDPTNSPASVYDAPCLVCSPNNVCADRFVFGTYTFTKTGTTYSYDTGISSYTNPTN